MKAIKTFFIAFILTFVSFYMYAANASSPVVGSVSTSFRMLGSNDSIKVIALNDPDLPSVHCYMSTAVTGGISGDLGLAEDKSEYDISCFVNGPLSVPDSLQQTQEVAMERRSAVFKKLHIVRFIDREQHRLVYMAYTTWLVDGSPKHAMASVGY